MRQSFELDTILGYQLQRAFMAMTTDARAMLEPHGLTPARLTALLLIRENPGCDQTALGRALNINRSSAMKLVNVLVASGLIERRAGRDMRTNALHLVPRGEAQIAEMLVLLRISDAQMSARLSDAERVALIALLGKLGPDDRKKRDPTPD